MAIEDKEIRKNEEKFIDFADIAVNLERFPKELLAIVESIQDELKKNPYETLDDRREDEEYINRILHLIALDSKSANRTVNESRQNEYRKVMDRYNDRKENAKSLDRRFEIDEQMNKDITYQLAKYIVSPEMKRTFRSRLKESDYEAAIKAYMTEAKRDKLSQDFFTQGGIFKEKPYPEVTVQENMYLANRCAHWCNDELNDIFNEFKITNKEGILKRKDVGIGMNYSSELKTEFKKRLNDALNYYNTQIPKDEKVDFKKLNAYLKQYKNKNEADRDYSEFCNNKEVQKINKLMQKYVSGQTMNFDSIEKYSKMFQLNQKTLEFFNLKNKLIEIELEIDNIAKKDYKETGGENIEKSTITFLIKDDIEKEDGEGTYRIITMNKEFYNDYVEYNNAIYISGSLAVNMTKEAGINPEDSNMTKTDCVDRVNEYLKDKGKYQELDSMEFEAMMKCGNITVCHAPESVVDKLIKEKNLNEIEMNPSICVQCLSRGVTSIPTNSEVPEELIEKKLGSYKEKNNKNREAYKDNHEEFKKNYNLIEEYAKDVREVELINE